MAWRSSRNAAMSAFSASRAPSTSALVAQGDSVSITALAERPAQPTAQTPRVAGIPLGAQPGGLIAGGSLGGLGVAELRK